MKRFIIFLISLLLVLGLMGSISYFSAMDGQDSHEKSKDLVKFIAKNFFKIDEDVSLRELQARYDDKIRKCAHFLEYCTLDILTVNLLIRITNRKRFLHFIVAIVFCVAFACVDEYHQSFIDGRTSKALDVYIDSAGILTGSFICCLIHIIRGCIKKRVE